MTWVVHKFGGTSVANAGRYRDVAKILEVEPSLKKGIVLSAMSGVTDALIQLLELAKRRDDTLHARIEELRKRHLDTVDELLPGGAGAETNATINAGLKDVGDVLRAVWLARAYSEQIMELVAGHGEIWSVQMFGAYVRSLGKSVATLDARDVLVVHAGELGPIVDWTVSEANTARWLEKSTAEWIVITGYVASTPEGSPTTLKRNGSDFSGAIFGRLLGAEAIVIWTDVDGVLSADPRRAPDAVVLREMSYNEAIELAYFGAKVIHPRTMQPAIDKGIPIHIRNTFNPTHPGTVIHHPKRAPATQERAVRGVSTMDGIALVNLEGSGMLGVPGVAQRLFQALREAAVSVILISQSSSEHSICVAIPQPQAARAEAALVQAFREEIAQRQIERVMVTERCTILAAVGDGMVRTPGVAGRMFAALGKVGVNVLAIALGSSERNISVVVQEKDSIRALRTVHSSFYLSDQTLSIGIVGPGMVGTALLRQIAKQTNKLRADFKIDLRVRGMMNSRKMLLDDSSINLRSWAERFATAAVPRDEEAFVNHVQSYSIPHALIVDCSGSQEIANEYPKWLERGIHVITPNKKAGAGPLGTYSRLRNLGSRLTVPPPTVDPGPPRRRSAYSRYYYEATVGAGLPVISTLRDLIQTGDTIVRIEGILSGTLSYVFNRCSDGIPFSRAVREAKELGYTEPDPRDDLSGIDVGRKLVILAREIGRPIELADVRIQNLVPDALRTVDPNNFFDELAAYDDTMARLFSDARARGEVPRYVGVVGAEGDVCVELRNYSNAHPFSRVTKTENIIAFTTERYCEQPLIVQGPGAGPEVTAAAVFADLLRLAAHLGAPT